MAQIFVSPFAQYTDGSGNPGSGDLLYFYTVGTTTAITIYSDVGLTTPQANPVVADSAGQWAAVYLAEQLYKVVMKSAAGVTIRTADPAGGDGVTGATSSTDNAVARWDGASGHRLQNSGVIIDDSNNVTGVVALTATGAVSTGALSSTTGAFSGALTGTTGAFSGALSAAGATPLQLTFVDAGTVGPTADIYLDSVSPAIGDIVGKLQFSGKDSGGNKTNYANINAQSDVVTNGAENGTINFQTFVSGVLSQKVSIFNTGFAVSGAASSLISADGSSGVGGSISSLGMYQGYITNNTPCQWGRSNSGDIMYFWTAGGNKGSISESGGTVSYNAFFGSHWSQLMSSASYTKYDILRGTICEAVNELCEWTDVEYEERLSRFKVSDTPGCKSAYGVFAWLDDEGDVLIGALGSYVIRVAKGVTVQNGDLLESNGDGCARVQTDDIMRSSTVAKVTAAIVTETYPDGSYLVPCTLHCG